METSRLKNIIIFILLLVNLFLLGILGMRRTSEFTSQRRTVQELTTLFASDGVSLAEDAVVFQPPPVGRSLSRDAGRERELAAFLLGEGIHRSDEGGGICIYSNENGWVEFRSGGSFSAVGVLGSDPAALYRRFCQNFGYESLLLEFDNAGSGSAHAVQYADGYPVVNCTVTFFAEEGIVTAVTGACLPPAGTDSASDSTLDAATALMSFLEMRRSSGAVVSAVTGVAPCYLFQTSASAPMSLVPAWHLSTDAGNFYVNCFTGAVTQS